MYSLHMVYRLAEAAMLSIELTLQSRCYGDPFAPVIRNSHVGASCDKEQFLNFNRIYVVTIIITFGPSI